MKSVRILFGWQKEAASTDRRQDKWHSHWTQWAVFGGPFCHHDVARPWLADGDDGL